jgi:hypothetical protein
MRRAEIFKGTPGGRLLMSDEYEVSIEFVGSADFDVREERCALLFFGSPERSESAHDS